MPRRARREPDQPRERRNRDAEVIDAAVGVFHRKGFGAASIQDVADEVGVLKGSLYYYIDSKEDLLFRIFMESYRQSAVILEEAVASDGSPLDRLRSYFERYVLWYLENLERVSIYFSELRHLTGERRKAILEQRRRYNEFVERLIDEAKTGGEVSPDLNTKFATFFILGAVNGLPAWYHRKAESEPLEIARSYTEMIIGMLTGAQPSLLDERPTAAPKRTAKKTPNGSAKRKAA
jgi:AcrR family transcriptional regulator